MTKKEIIFGAGCFWGVEELFRTTQGVLDTEVGYAGGLIEKPTYEDVCSSDTGHAEVVRVVYDEDEISSKDIIRLFYNSHDPTQKDGQGVDIGDQYRSVIFYSEEMQKEISEQIKDEDERLEGVIYTTQILPVPSFYPAEDYHQKYLMKQNAKVCH